MSEIVATDVYDRKGKLVTLERIQGDMYEIVEHDGDKTVRTGNIVNLRTSIQCDSLFTPEKHAKFLRRKKRSENESIL